MIDNQEFGIDAIKEALENAYGVFKKFEEAASDGKVTWIETLSLSLGAIPKAYDTIKNGKLIALQFKDMDESESTEIKLWFEDMFDLENDEAELKIEAIFNWLLVTAETCEIIM